MDKGKTPLLAGDSPVIHPSIWRAIAGTAPDIPPAGSPIYYFLDGHSEQCTCPPDISGFFFECHLAAVNLHADPTTEQLFATFTLTTDLSPPATSDSHPIAERRVASVGKMLTRSETECEGEGFLKLPERAERVFRYARPGDYVDVYDLNNRRWTFRHVLSGSPLRHCLTDGWAHFVACKVLVAGDAVVFVRDDDGIIFVGLKRCEDQIVYNVEAINRLKTKKLFKKKEETEVVRDAAKWMEEGGPGTIEVGYYPDIRLPVYVVDKDVVDAAVQVPWVRGIRVAKKCEMEDWTMLNQLGTITSISPDSEYTPWRMLEVIWENYTQSYENPWDLLPYLT